MYYPTIIYFNPNAENYQGYAHSPTGFWLQFFLENKINVFCWNYRNYGKSKGMPDPYTCYHDSESILKFLIKDLGIKGKIGCFGRSIGGTMATHLANHYSQHIDFLFIDRSLGSLHSISQNIIQGDFSPFLSKYLSNNWVINSDKNFYEAQCFKMLTQDPNDDIVDRYSALNAHVASIACKDFIGEDRYDSLKLMKVFKAIRMLYKIDVKMQSIIKNKKKLLIKKN